MRDFSAVAELRVLTWLQRLDYVTTDIVSGAQQLFASLKHSTKVVYLLGYVTHPEIDYIRSMASQNCLLLTMMNVQSGVAVRLNQDSIVSIFANDQLLQADVGSGASGRRQKYLITCALHIRNNYSTAQEMLFLSANSTMLFSRTHQRILDLKQA